MLLSLALMPARDRPSPDSLRWVERAGIALLLALLGSAWWTTAWVSDDAFITLRTVDNALHGHGLVWNVGQRVQTYTHPLWMGLVLVASSLTGELFFTLLALSAVATAVALAVLARGVGASRAGVALALAAALASRAFVDYASSGLENPLVHALVLGLFAVCARRGEGEGLQLARVGLLAACLLTRLDLLFLAAPLAAFAWRRDGLPRARVAIAGVAPLVAWEAFSLVYYGALVANSALAKLAAGIPVGARVARGALYFASSLRDDPVSIALLVGAPALAFAVRDALRVPGAVAIAAHCAWVVWVGGDFMRGRFLTPALAVALALLARAGAGRERAAWAGAAALAIGTVAIPYLSPFVARDYGPEWHAAIDAHGFADERHFHVDISSLASARRGEGFASADEPERVREARAAWFRDPWIDALAAVGVLDEGDAWPPRSEAEAARVRPVLVKGGVGLLGYRMGPGVHVIDYHGLGDPLLARLPALREDPVLARLIPRLAPLGWRTGHYLRPVPAGYAASRSAGENLVADPDLHALVDRIDLVTSGPLFAAERWRAIADLHGAFARERIARWAERRRVAGAPELR
ncbi:MAG: hypothetical protein R3E88_18390 [Myxococcota bacterium]